MRWGRISTRSMGSVAFAAAVLGGLPVAAQSPNCMDDRFPGNLGCTANDVRIAKVTNINVQSCTLGTSFSFTADFFVELTAQTRYDVGLYFATDGDLNNDGALTGQCSVGVITPQNSANFVNLDLPRDTCGDINGSHNPQIVHLTLTTLCIDPDHDGKLNLPNCTSWRQSGANTLCDDPGDAFPGSPSKCKCDKAFNIDILVEQPSLTVEKTADPTQVLEPGGDVTYTVTITNDGVVTPVTLTTIVDDPDNDPSTNNSVTYDAADVCIDTVLSPGGSTTCTFVRAVSGNAGQSFTDRACVNGTDSNGKAVGPTCDTASVSIDDVAPTGTVTKTLDSLVCSIVRYKVKVENTDRVEALTLSALSDSPFGNITQVQGNVVATTCSVPQQIATSSHYQCTFDAKVCSSPHVDTVTGTLSDNDGNTITPSGQVQVTTTATSP